MALVCRIGCVGLLFGSVMSGRLGYEICMPLILNLLWGQTLDWVRPEDTKTVFWKRLEILFGAGIMV